eukprot:6562536-Alexandrium_andersonii.AAC.1
MGTGGGQLMPAGPAWPERARRDGPRRAHLNIRTLMPTLAGLKRVCHYMAAGHMSATSERIWPHMAAVHMSGP